MKLLGNIQKMYYNQFTFKADNLRGPPEQANFKNTNISVNFTGFLLKLAAIPLSLSQHKLQMLLFVQVLTVSAC